MRARRENYDGGRVARHVVRVSPEEEARLVLRANSLGVTVARLMVESALSETPGETVTQRRADLAELFRLIRILSGVATNLNQVAKIANGTGEIPGEAAGVIVTVKNLLSRVDAALDQLGLGESAR